MGFIPLTKMYPRPPLSLEKVVTNVLFEFCTMQTLDQRELQLFHLR